MSKNVKGTNTICTHIGTVKDNQFKGVVSPIYLASSYAYIDVNTKRYPRYFNTPNQQYLCNKITALEKAESALIFSSGMAAISTTLLAFLRCGDHIVLQGDIYGGTRNLVYAHFDNYGIEYTFTKGITPEDFSNEIKVNTKLIYIESPSNPLLKIVDIKTIAEIANSHSIISIIDNTFATPIVQQPINLGIDIVLHSATKYFGGHSDLCAGAVATSNNYCKKIWNLAKDLGGNLSDISVWILERSMKTLGIRVEKQQKNAIKLAIWLQKQEYINKVHYPGLESHKNHNLAKNQMSGFGAMISFELHRKINVSTFLNATQLVNPSMSLAGVESTMVTPAHTSHALLTAKERKQLGIGGNLVRLSVGIENIKDLKNDIKLALHAATGS